MAPNWKDSMDQKAQEGYFEYGNFENCNFDTTVISKNLWLVISKKSDCNFEFYFEKVNFENVLRNHNHEIE